jgi:hypothetical protein
MVRYSREYLDFLERGEQFTDAVLSKGPMTLDRCVELGEKEGFSRDEVLDFLAYLKTQGALTVTPPPGKLH